MMSIPSAVEVVVKKRPFLEGALVEGLVNLSALARQLKPEIEKIVGREVNDSAVIMALNRLVPRLDVISARDARVIVENVGDITVRSNLAEFTFHNSHTLHIHQARLLEKVKEHNNFFCSISQGVYETTIVVSEAIAATVEELFAEEALVTKSADLSIITVKLPADNTLCPGVYYYLFKELAWDNVNVLEVISTTNELTLVVSNSDIHRAFAVLMNAKNKPVAGLR